MMGAGPQKSLAEVEPGKGVGQDGVQGVQGVQVEGAEKVEPQQAVLLVEKA